MEGNLFIFINPESFADLLRNDELYNLVRDMSRERDVIYLWSNQAPTRESFDSTKTTNALAVLIPDSHEPIQYTPSRDFKVLHHTTGPTQNLREDLLSSPFYKGVRREPEDLNTLFDKLATAIENNNLLESLKEIYDEIKNFNPLLEAQLELLHNCLCPETMPEKVEDVPNFLRTDYKIFKDKIDKISKPEWNCDEYIKALRELRDSLLGL